VSTALDSLGRRWRPCWFLLHAEFHQGDAGRRCYRLCRILWPATERASSCFVGDMRGRAVGGFKARKCAASSFRLVSPKSLSEPRRPLPSVCPCLILRQPIPRSSLSP
jgi:hypothetical protein